MHYSDRLDDRNDLSTVASVGPPPPPSFRMVAGVRAPCASLPPRHHSATLLVRHLLPLTAGMNLSTGHQERSVAVV